jgi:hypothetical protein
MKKLILALLLICVLLVSGCRHNSNGINSENSTNNPQQTPTDDKTSNDNSANDSSIGGEALLDASELFSDRDFEVDFDERTSVIILLNGDTASCVSDNVEISGNTVIIADEGTYILSGTLNNGTIIVDSGKKDKVQLVLNNASIHSERYAPIYIQKSDKVFITLAPNSVNTLSNGGSFTAINENKIDAVIFSKEDLTLNGTGSLTISSPAGHGIVSKDGLTLTGGSYEINSASHGLEGKDNVCIANAELKIRSGKDGIHAENSDDTTLGFVYIQSGTFNITSGGDGISASAQMQIDGGTFHIVSGSGSMKAEKSSTNSKGLKAAGHLTINGGSFTIDAADDAVHSSASMNIAGGTFEIATDDDGFHADETMIISSGTINITRCYEGLEGLHVKISGGDISLYAGNDGINAAGGTDQSDLDGKGGEDKFDGGEGGSSSSNGSIVISGGKLYIHAASDGIDANGTLTISGGYTVVCGPSSGDTASLDYDISGVITGGTFIGTGASDEAKNFSDSEQGVIAERVGHQPAGTTIALTDADGNTIIPSYAPELDFEFVILSSPELVKGKTYTMTIGSSTHQFTAS